MNDRWIKIISNDGHIRGVAVYAQGVVSHAAKIHGLSRFPAVALGEAMISGLLFSSYSKGEQRFNLNIQTTGIIRQVFVDAYPDGTVRGYLLSRNAEDAAHDASRGPWSEGMLSVLRTNEKFQNKPYVGTVPLVTGHLAKDMSYYWLQSEQVPSAVGLCVTESFEGDIGPAGGFLVQAMPDAPSSTVRTIENHINHMPSLAHKLVSDENPIHILSEIFQSTPFFVLEEKKVSFSCRCSLDKVRQALTFVGSEELTSILSEEKRAAIRCDFCAKEYVISEEELQKIIKEVKSN